MKTGNGYSEEPTGSPEQNVHQKSSSMMHEEASDDSYLQVRVICYSYRVTFNIMLNRIKLYFKQYNDKPIPI